MPADNWDKLQALFEACVDLTAAEAADYLDRHCNDPETRRTVEAMLAADGGDDPIADSLRGAAQRELDRGGLQPGQRVDAYTVSHLLGRGGMGAVYLAERSDEQYQQDVVIKLVNAPTSGIPHERFRRERQILADLNHPYIARLLDGGALDDGTPYLVMEHVRGDDIASYCETHALPVHQRIELLIRVCEAVQYLHANLIVHRDIKPANVLVDDQGVPKLLDFGIAKLLEQEPQAEPGAHQRGSQALDPSQTMHGGALMSPAWASPEQHRGEAITTASDVFSLGALLYRLLTGRPPRDAAPGTMAALPPPPPSEILRQAGSPAVARAARGDLDAIAARALDEDPGARYASAADLADDLRRHLEMQPVLARGAGWSEAMTKFARRNRGLTATLASTLLLIIAFAVGMTLLAVRLDTERERAARASAATQQVADFMVELFAGADPEANTADAVTARDLLERGATRLDSALRDQPLIRSRLLGRMAEAYGHLGMLDRALELYDTALAARGERPPDWQLQLERADLQREMGQLDEAQATFQQAIEALRDQPREKALLAKAYNDYGILLGRRERYQGAETYARKALDIEFTGSEVAHTRTSFRHNLAIAIHRQGRNAEARELLKQVIAAKRESLGDNHPSLLRSREVLAQVFRDANDLDRAAIMLQRIIDQRIAIYGESSLSIARVRNELANVYHDAAEYPRAEHQYRAALQYLDANADTAPLLHAYVVNNLGSLYMDTGDLARAEPLLRRSLRMRVTLNGVDDIVAIRARIKLARLLVERERIEPAAELLQHATAQLTDHYPDNDYRRASAAIQEALILAHRDQPDQATRVMRAAVERIVADQPVNSRSRARALAAAVRMHLVTGRYKAALKAVDNARATFDATHGADHPKQLRLDIWKARALAETGRSGEARAILERSFPRLLESYTDEAPIVVQAKALQSELAPAAQETSM